MKRILASAKTGSRTKLVFVAACQSEQTGRVFEKAGVEHVVAVKQKIVDTHARWFTRFFYKYLLEPLSVREAFELAVQSVMLEFRVENHFVLLPAEDRHEEVLFKDSIPGRLEYSTSRCLALLEVLPPHHIEQHSHMKSIYKFLRGKDDRIVTGAATKETYP
jgi:CHAT domain